MHEYDRRLHKAIEEYKAEDERYDARVSGAAIQIIDHFLRPLEMRKAGQTESRQQFIQETIKEIENFEETRISLRSAVASVRFATSKLRSASLIRGIQKFNHRNPLKLSALAMT